MAKRTVVEFSGLVDITQKFSGCADQPRTSFSTSDPVTVTVYLEDNVEQPQAGDSVKCAISGKITGFSGSVEGLYFTVEDSHGNEHTILHSDLIVTEKAERFETGEVYVSSAGRKYLRQASTVSPWCCLDNMRGYSENTPNRPLTKMVPEKK